jgi:protein phosphatase 1G
MRTGGAEVARFCQKYMAGEIAKMQQYKDGNISDSLVNVFHKMDDMLRDTKYQEEVRRPNSDPRGSR